MNNNKREEKYQILFDYGSYEGMKFYDEKSFDTMDAAIKFAVALGYTTKFLIVQVAWNPDEVTKQQEPEWKPAKEVFGDVSKMEFETPTSETYSADGKTTFHYPEPDHWAGDPLKNPYKPTNPTEPVKEVKGIYCGCNFKLGFIDSYGNEHRAEIVHYCPLLGQKDPTTKETECKRKPYRCAKGPWLIGNSMYCPAGCDCECHGIKITKEMMEPKQTYSEMLKEDPLGGRKITEVFKTELENNNRFLKNIASQPEQSQLEVLESYIKNEVVYEIGDKSEGFNKALYLIINKIHELKKGK